MPLDDIVVIEVIQQGAQGIPGTDGADGPQNLFVQQTDPGMITPGLWIELDGGGDVKTFWVENGI